MPSPDVIREKIHTLKSYDYTLGQKPQQDEVWSGQEYNVRFELTVDKAEGETWTLDLFVEDDIRGRERLLEDFVTVLGEPSLVFPDTLVRDALVASWNTYKDSIKIA